MIVDTSVIMAILLDEPEAARFRRALGDSDRNLVAAGSWVELAAVLTRRGFDFWEALTVTRRSYRLTIAPLEETQAETAHAAYRKYGIGTRHAAQLNFGDCFAYALAIERGEPLLFKGEDFKRTDVTVAAY